MKIGFIGMGHMGTAILQAMISKKTATENDIYISRLHHKKNFSNDYENKIHHCMNNTELAKHADIIVLAIKPNVISEVLREIYEVIDNKLIISIAAGWSPNEIERIIPKKTRYICVMPNTPVLVKKGIVIINRNGRYTESDFSFVRGMFKSMGEVLAVDDIFFNVAGTISGCGPAIMYEFIEAMCDISVCYGLPKDIAITITSQMIIGAAEMVLKTKKHPLLLKDEVCSPGGTTIEGIYSLHKGNFHAVVMDAFRAAIAA